MDGLCSTSLPARDHNNLMAIIHPLDEAMGVVTYRLFTTPANGGQQSVYEGVSGAGPMYHEGRVEMGGPVRLRQHGEYIRAGVEAPFYDAVRDNAENFAGY